MAFFRDPSTGIQSFGIQSFASAESGHANCGTGSLPGAVDRRIACGNFCGNPIDGRHWRARVRQDPQAAPERWVRRWVEFASISKSAGFIEISSRNWRMGCPPRRLLDQWVEKGRALRPHVLSHVWLVQEPCG